MTADDWILFSPWAFTVLGYMIWAFCLRVKAKSKEISADDGFVYCELCKHDKVSKMSISSPL